MPAKLPYPAVKTDIRLWADDVAFLAPYLEARNSDITTVTRELVHRYANQVRAQLSLAPTAPHPPGKLP